MAQAGPNVKEVHMAIVIGTRRTPIKKQRGLCDDMPHYMAALLAFGLVLGLPAQSDASRSTTSTATQLPDQAWGYSFPGLTGGRIDLSAFRGRTVLVVNTASQCGFTGQYQGLQALWRQYERRGLVVVGVPSNDFGGQEPGSSAEISRFCEINYGVTFPLTSRQRVVGTGAHPFFRWAEQSFGVQARPRWNFHKILIGPDGRIRAAFASAVEPSDPRLRAAIEAALPAPRRPATR
jgi:glutathione peroxidase